MFTIPSPEEATAMQYGIYTIDQGPDGDWRVYADGDLISDGNASAKAAKTEADIDWDQR